MNAKQNQTRCKAHTKTGKPCRAAATAGGLCFFHANPNKASELGRIGGRKNRHAVADAAALPPMATAIAVRDNLTRIINDVFSGQLHPKIAVSLAPLLNLRLRAIQVSELERQLENLKKESADAQLKESVVDTGEAPPPDRGNLRDGVGKSEAEDGSKKRVGPIDPEPEESY